jgi:DNA polymerase delta subunit 1
LLITIQAGNSVLLHVTDFQHYLYVAAPVSFTEADCDPYRSFLNTICANSEPVVSSVRMLLRENIYGFQGNQKSPYLQINVNDPRSIAKVRTAISKKRANYKGLWGRIEGDVMTFDNIEYILRFMIDTGVRTNLIVTTLDH